MCVSPLIFPIQVLKVRLNLQQAATYNGVVAGARSIYRQEPLSSFYRGFKPSILCMIPYAGVECAVHQVRCSKDQTRVHLKDTVFNYLLLIAVDHELGEE